MMISECASQPDHVPVAQTVCVATEHVEQVSASSTARFLLAARVLIMFDLPGNGIAGNASSSSAFRSKSQTVAGAAWRAWLRNNRGLRTVPDFFLTVFWIYTAAGLVSSCS